jgi:hypothetical protein
VGRDAWHSAWVVIRSWEQAQLSVMVVCLRLQVHQHLREELAKVKTLDGIAAVSQALKLQCQASAGLHVPSRWWARDSDL